MVSEKNDIRRAMQGLMQDRADAILRDHAAAAAARAGFRSVWQEIADHLLGRRDFSGTDAGAGPHGGGTPGRKRGARICDTTGLQAADMLAAALHAFLTNPAVRWFALKPEDGALADLPGVQDWLEAVEEAMYAAFNAGGANFAPQLHEVYLDLVAFGTAALYVGDRPGRGPLFSARPLGEIAIAEGAEGEVDSVFRAFRLTARQADAAFGDAAGRAVASALASGQGERPVAFLHAVRPVGEIGGKAGAVLAARGFRFASTYLAVEERRVVAAGGYHEMPYMVPRWSKDAGEVYGRSPGWNALADQKMLNEMSRTVLKAAQKAVDPPLLVADDGVLMPLRPLPAPQRLDIGLEMMEQRREAVRAAFHHALLQMFRDPRMTATQVLQMVQEMQRLLGPMLARQQAELLEPMIERVFAILSRARLLPPPPPALAGRRLAVDYVSPIARAQKSGDAQAVLRTLEAAAALSAIDPAAGDLIDADAGLRVIAEANGTPARVLRDADAVALLRAARVAGEVAVQASPFETPAEAGAEG